MVRHSYIGQIRLYTGQRYFLQRSTRRWKDRIYSFFVRIILLRGALESLSGRGVGRHQLRAQIPLAIRMFIGQDGLLGHLVTRPAIPSKLADFGRLNGVRGPEQPDRGGRPRRFLERDFQGAWRQIG
jgi:hypothetical protein